MRTQAHSPESPAERADSRAGPVTASRRALLGKGAAVAAAAAAAAAAGLATSQRVTAGNGDTIYVGQDHTATAQTKISGGSTLWVQDGATSGAASVYGTQGPGAGSYGIHGAHSGSEGIGVFGEATGGAGIGVYAQSSGTEGVGVFAKTAGTPGTAVRGEAAFGDGVVGDGSRYDLRADGSGRVGLTRAGNTGSPTDTGITGTIARDSSGNLWYCYSSNQWQRLGSPDAAGAYHSIEPTRVFDSRQAATPGSGAFAAGEKRVVSIKDGRTLGTGVVDAVDLVPVNATAITFNVTATQTTAPSFLAVGPGDAATVKASSLNWTGGGATVANGTATKLDGSRQVTIFSGPNGSFHAIIDVTGYYL